ncbi:MAG: hypothetical protein Q7S21_06025 [archaeon]|nr:hypothetical protein [archaeon]
MLSKKNRRLPEEGKKIQKAEDKDWGQWYSKLSVQEHEEMLSKLGFDKEELEEWEEETHLKKQNENSKNNKKKTE